ncbi:hypothetical protein BGY98DRAFT_1014388 [Russula aff. rugulosa BPL654]|nr:hypothetical protein BGY98DRAFT_1014388 [Russula aff. rugulosa BPL654]
MLSNATYDQAINPVTHLPLHRCITNMVAKLLSFYLLVVASLGVVQAAPLVLDQRQDGGPGTLTVGPTPTGTFAEGPSPEDSDEGGWRRGLILDERHHQGGAVARGPAGTLTQEA